MSKAGKRRSTRSDRYLKKDPGTNFHRVVRDPSRRAGNAIEPLIDAARKKMEHEAQHGPVKIIVKDGKSV